MLYLVNLYDLAPRIGSGYRLVEAALGRKWVRLRYQPRCWRKITLDDGAKLDPVLAKIPLATWQRLPKEEIRSGRGGRRARSRAPSR